MLTAKIEWAEDHTGMVGFMLFDRNREAEIEATWDGRLIAHDLIDHINGPAAIGTLEDEIQALGAMAFSRADVDIRYDLSYTLEPYIDNELPIVLPPVEAITKHLMDDFFPPIIEDVGLKLNSALPDAQIFAYLCMGYDKAEAKYKDSASAYALFKMVEETVNTIEVDEVNLGDVFTIHYNQEGAYIT